uniref:Chromo domain-containing protein n=1 Tax=Caenorhabditis tropicalis TaxID=1561998 RepID=A0A1I7U809_9PELO
MPKFKVGETVRILLENSPFAKGTRAKWTEEIFVVNKILKYDIPVYILNDMKDREVDGIWYEEEMILYKKPDNVFKIDKIIRKRTKNGKREVFVSFKGYDSSFNCWIPQSDLL